MLREFSLQQTLDHRPIHHVVRWRCHVAEIVHDRIVVAHPGKRAQLQLRHAVLGGVVEHAMLLSHGDDYASPCSTRERVDPVDDVRVLKANDRPLVETYDCAMLDLDGVVYVGQAAVPGAPGLLQQVRASGVTLAFVTNNAARTPEAVADASHRPRC